MVVFLLLKFWKSKFTVGGGGRDGRSDYRTSVILENSPFIRRGPSGAHPCIRPSVNFFSLSHLLCF